MQWVIYIFVIPVVALIGGGIIGLYAKGVDRKFAAYYQSRIGPPIRQPFYDISKLMQKQTIIPENAVGWIFRGAPFVALSSSVVLLVYVLVPYFAWIGGYNFFFSNSGDIILILYLLMIPSIALVAGGFASGSPYATLGAQREMVILMSIELPLAVTAVTFAWRLSHVVPDASHFSLVTMSSHPLWWGMGPFGILGGLLLALSIAVVIPAELAKIPFDQAEAETEIAEGLLAEYSGKYLALYQIADGIKSLAVISLAVILFFPHGFVQMTGYTVQPFGYDITLLLDIFIFMVKVFLVYFVSVTTVRIAMARLKISQVAQLFLITITVMSLAGYLLITLDPVIRTL
jgi:formate hydrogenlyase subunit 4